MTAARTPDQVHQAVMHMPPQGWAWPRDPNSHLGKTLQPLATEGAAFEARIEALLAEATPSSATELLPDYERVLGPDPCLGPAPTSLEQRRLSAHARWTAKGGASIATLTALAARLGYAITIEEFRRARAGITKAGQRCYPAGVRHTWRVHAPASRVVVARASVARAGDKLTRQILATVLECHLRRAAPAHTTLIIAYDGA